MALIKCSECGKEISDKAERCPNCGCPVANIIEENKKIISDEKKENTAIKKNKLSKGRIIAIIAVILAIILSVIIYLVLTSNDRTYNSAIQLFDKGMYQEALDEFSKLDDYKDSKDQVKKCNYELSVDGQFIRKLSTGLMARWDETNIQKEKGNAIDTHTLYKKYCEIELEYIEDFSDKKFNNSDLGICAKQYIEYLKEAKEATKFYSSDYYTYCTRWSDIYSKRTILLKKLIEEYGLSVNSKYKEVFDEILNDASGAQEQLEIEESVKKMTNNFKIIKAKDEWGFSTYKITMKNTTNRTFEYFSVQINLEDKNNNIICTGSSSQVNYWKPGQEATVDVWFEDSSINPNDHQIEYIMYYEFEI